MVIRLLQFLKVSWTYIYIDVEEVVVFMVEINSTELLNKRVMIQVYVLIHCVFQDWNSLNFEY